MVQNFIQGIVITFKVPHSLGPGYLRNCLAPMGLACPIGHSGKTGLLWDPLAKEFQLMVSRRRTIFDRAPALWNILAPEVRCTSTLPVL